MALPMTRSAMEALGKRLVKFSPPKSDDIELLQELLLSFDGALTIAVDLVRDHLAHEPTSRIKTTGTILDKLHRHGGSILKDMQDLAGMRIVHDCDRREQDRLAGDLVDLFKQHGNPPPKLVDRRKYPSYGYRAVHIIVYVDSTPVEIQLRTKLQHEWADLFEKLADRVGRGIRYGEPPEHWRDRIVIPNIHNAQQSSERERLEKQVELLEKLYISSYRARESTVAFAHSLADVIDVYEREVLNPSPEQLSELDVSITDGFAKMRFYIDEMGAPPPPTSS
ncbi:MAG: hypothetical protein LC808_13300 [Actinobacteria bacterium]|nr:hypothetical protein [Actinomycetota bacterium]